MGSASTAVSRRILDHEGNLKVKAVDRLDSYLDPQRLKEYDWEEAFIFSRGQKFESIKDAKKWVKWACGQFGVDVPKVYEQPRNRDASCYRPVDHTIWLKRAHWNPTSALHEAAHAIIEKKFEVTGHGPRFVAVLIWLLERSGCAPRTALTASAKAAGLKFSPLWTVDPRRKPKSRNKSKRRGKR